MSVEEQAELRQMLSPPKPRYCDGCEQAIGWRSKIIEIAPWLAGIFGYVTVLYSYPFIFGIDPTFFPAFTNMLDANYPTYALYFRVMNLGWPVVGGFVAFLVSARIRQFYRDDRVGLINRRVPFFGFYLPRLYYTRKVNRNALAGSEARPIPQ